MILNCYNILCVGAGSCLGGMARYVISRYVDSSSGSGFPWGTLAVNLLGCLCLGLIYGLLARNLQLSEGMRLFLTVGFCGGFTTFSTFINENYLMLTNGEIASSILYAALSLIGGLLLLYIGYLLPRL